MKEINSEQTKSIQKISKLNVWFIIFLIAIGIFPKIAEAQDTITLSEAVTSGLANKKNIVAGKLDLSISNLQTKALYQKYLPQVSGEYTYLYNPILQTSIIPIGVFNPSYPSDATKSVQFGTKWSQSAGITAIVPFFDLSIKSNINVAKLQERIVALSQEQSEYELAYTIIQTYIDIYTEEAKIKSQIADTSRTYISYLLLKNKFEEKRLLKSDLNKSKINHNNTVQLLTNGIAQLIQDKVYLLFLMGKNEMGKWDFEIDSNFTIKYTFENLDNKNNITQIPEIRQLSLQRELSILQEKSEKMKHLPTAGFKGYLGANQYTNSFDPIASNTWFGQSYIGLDIKIPILFGERTSNKIKQTKMESNQFTLQKENKEFQYAKDAILAKIKMDNLKTQLKIQAENIALSIESIDIFQARFKEGQESASNLNLEEASLQILKAEYEVSKKELWIYWLDYLKATGQLSILWK